MSKGVKSIETRHYEERDAFFAGLAHMSRRGFLRLAGISAGIAAAKGLVTPRSFQLVDVAVAQPVPGTSPGTSAPKLTFAYISDTHLYPRTLNDRFVRAIVKAVDDVNNLDPQPDFVLFGGDLAQLGRKDELDLGQQILKGVKAPIHMMVGEHDWFFDMGEHWRALFGPEQYSFDHKGVHFVTIMSEQEQDFWPARGMTPAERMQTVAGLGNGVVAFRVGGPTQVARRRPHEVNGDARRRVLALAALQVLPPLELLDRGRRRGAGDPEAVPEGDRDPRPHAPAPDERDREHPVPRHAVDGVAVALCARRLAEAHHRAKPRRSLQPVRRLRRGSIEVLEEGAGERAPTLGRNPVSVRTSYVSSTGSATGRRARSCRRTRKEPDDAHLGLALWPPRSSSVRSTGARPPIRPAVVPPSKSGDVVVALCDGQRRPRCRA
jgi:hypothetical protein